MNARVIYNPSAGMRTAREQLDFAVGVLRERGWFVDQVETVHPGEARSLARAAADAGLDAVIAVGGDGTVNEVANGVVDSPTSLAVLPFGTANVWAKEMGLPHGDLAGAARLTTDARPRLIDVGQVSGPSIEPRIFVLWCGVGLDAAITRDVEPQRDMKRRLGAMMFWYVGIRKALNYRGQRAKLEVEGRITRVRVILTLAANAQLYGGIVRIAPNARLDDGILNVLVFKGTGFAETALHMIRVLLQRHLLDPQVLVYQTNCIRIEGKNLPVHVDAEPIGYAPVEIRLRPRALSVLVPKTANQDLFSNS